MKSEKRIFIAFILNFGFSIINFIGGALTGSVAIISDAVHDLGDAISIGLSYILEKISKKEPDYTHTYGYLRYSVLGSVITTVILTVGSIFVIVNGVNRLINPVPINYNGMIILAIFGAGVNICASLFTSGGHSLNQKAVNLHMLEDVLGWIVVLIGAVIMKFTDFSYIDPIMSIGVAVFILINAIKNFVDVLNIFLEKTPKNVDITKILATLLEIDGVKDVHHFHIRSIDGFNNVATLHIVTDENFTEIKTLVKNSLKEQGISHSTVEIESSNEACDDTHCHAFITDDHADHHHHHHHH